MLQEQWLAIHKDGQEMQPSIIWHFQIGLSGVTDWSEKLWDYIRYFHNNKAIKPCDW